MLIKPNMLIKSTTESQKKILVIKVFVLSRSREDLMPGQGANRYGKNKTIKNPGEPDDDDDEDTLARLVSIAHERLVTGSLPTSAVQLLIGTSSVLFSTQPPLPLHNGLPCVSSYHNCITPCRSTPSCNIILCDSPPPHVEQTTAREESCLLPTIERFREK